VTPSFFEALKARLVSAMPRHTASDDLDALIAEVERLRARLRGTAQLLIAEVGACGPMDAEEAAKRAVAEVVRLREENELLRKDLKEEREDAVAYLHRIAKQGKDGAHTLNFQFAANTIKVGEHRSNKALPLW